MARIVITGAAGFIGSHVTKLLLGEGHQVVGLVRDEPGRPAETHARNQLGRTHIDNHFLKYFSVVPVDIADFDVMALRSRLGSVDSLWHCAALVSLNDAREAETQRSNVDGTQKIVQLAEELNANVHYISTAYVAGSHSGIFREDDLDVGQTFRNAYERTKFEAEKLVRSALEENRIKGNIYRLGIVIGDSVTGATTSFLGYYQCLALMAHFASRGNSSIRVPGNPEACLSLVPLDYVLQTLRKLSAEIQNKTFHLISPQPPSVGWWLRESLAAIGIERVEVVDLRDWQPRGDLEAALYGKLQPFLPYMSGEPQFGHSNVVSVLGEDPRLKLDVGYVKRVVNFAVRNNFGQPVPVGTRT